MRVLFGCQRDKNSFLGNSVAALEAAASDSKREIPLVEIGTEPFWSETRFFDIVNLHWPESLYDGRWWLDRARIEEICERVCRWKRRGSKVCVTRHDVRPLLQSKSLDSVDYYRPLFAQVDGVIHLGHASLEDFRSRYGHHPWAAQIRHAVVPHPGYFDLPNALGREDSRGSFSIDDGMRVVLVFGKVRTDAECRFIERVFEGIAEPAKLLIVPRWRRLCEPQVAGDSYRIGFDFVENAEVQRYVNAADVILVPRLSSSCLNSGVIPLALTFGRIPVGPSRGVMGELLRDSENPTFEGESSAIQAVESVLRDPRASLREEANAAYARAHLSPLSVGRRLLSFYDELVSG